MVSAFSKLQWLSQMKMQIKPQVKKRQP